MIRPRSLVTGILCILLLASCTKQRVRKEVSIGKEAINVMMPTGKEINHPVHGKEEFFSLGAMNGSVGTNANGVAQSHVFADEATIVTVNLNIQPAAKGSHYVAWLSKEGTIERVRLDTLKNPLQDVRHVITVEIAKDLRQYVQVMVTAERDTGMTEGDPVVATGKLKTQSR